MATTDKEIARYEKARERVLREVLHAEYGAQLYQIRGEGSMREVYVSIAGDWLWLGRYGEVAVRPGLIAAAPQHVPVCVIAVVASRSLPGEYKYSYADGGKTHTGTCSGAADAAGHAMQIAIIAGRGGYAIFGPGEVLAHIPGDLRSFSGVVNH